jgi:hypothetical protein
MSKKLTVFLSVLALSLLLPACDKPKNKSGGFSPQPGDELIGYWQNTTTLSSRERHSGIMMRLHFYRENGVLAVQWCASDGSAGLSKYKVEGKRLVINGRLDKSDINSADIDLNAEITSFQPDQLILNGSNVYQRFTPDDPSNQVCVR